MSELTWRGGDVFRKWLWSDDLRGWGSVTESTWKRETCDEYDQERVKLCYQTDMDEWKWITEVTLQSVTCSAKLSPLIHWYLFFYLLLPLFLHFSIKQNFCCCIYLSILFFQANHFCSELHSEEKIAGQRLLGIISPLLASKLSWITIWQEVVWRVSSLSGPIVQVSKHFSATQVQVPLRKKCFACL